MENSLMTLADLPEEAREEVNAYEQNNPDWQNKDKENYRAMDWLLYILHSIPKAIKIYDENAIGEDILKDTLGDIGVWAKNCRSASGEWGLLRNGYGWLESHVNGRLFKVGRLQFIPKLFNWNFKIFCDKTNGNVIAISPDSGTYTEGTVISPYGYALDKTVSLDMDAWHEVLPQGAPVFELHIQQGGKFDAQSCRKSFQGIIKFADKHYEMLAKIAGIDENKMGRDIMPFAAFVCESWLLDAQLDGIMPPSSNIVKFLREFYLLPCKSGDEATLERVFGWHGFDINNIKPEQEKTSMQRAIIDYMRRGGRMGSNKGFILARNIDKYGAEQYRVQSYFSS